MKQVSYSEHTNIRPHHNKFSLPCDLLLKFVQLCVEQKAGPPIVGMDKREERIRVPAEPKNPDSRGFLVTELFILCALSRYLFFVTAMYVLYSL
jgi:hypothetical protein